jgi:hypothetical protein
MSRRCALDWGANEEETRDLLLLLLLFTAIAGHVARMGEERGVHRGLVGKPEGNRPLGRPRRRWDLQKVGVVMGNGWSWLRIGTGGGHL